MIDYVVKEVSPRHPEVVALLDIHLKFAADQSPPEHVHALDLDALDTPDVTFFELRGDSAILAIGAIQELDPEHAELKSIHTSEAARGQGVGKTMVSHLMSVASERGYRRLSLETGAMDAFIPSRRLYESLGFVRVPPFGDYWDNEYSVCYSIELHPNGEPR